MLPAKDPSKETVAGDVILTLGIQSRQLRLIISDLIIGS